MFGLNAHIYKPGTHLLLYSLLLIATPFLLLQNYLQSFIGRASAFGMEILGANVPLSLFILSLLFLFLIIRFWNKFSRNRLLGWGIIFLMFFIGQKITDFYFDHNFYDLQYNWHYFAYAIFAFLNYRLHKQKGSPPEKIILTTFFYALLISTFDEAVQVPLSNRIFDFGDIAKDLWGAMMGLVFVFMVLENGKVLKSHNSLRQKTWKDYLKRPVSLFFVQLLFAFIFMFVASNTSDSEYWLQTIFISLLLFLLFVLIFHYSQYRKSGIVLVVIGAVIVGLQIFFFFKHREDKLVYTGNNLIVYKGIPVFFFDLMVYPNGNFRIVDKKEYFNNRDKNTIMDLAENILIVGNGSGEVGNAGWVNDPPVQFIYHENRKMALQVMVLGNRDAMQKFNQLTEAGKRPMLIMHNDRGGAR